MSHSTQSGFREPQSAVATTARNFRLPSMSSWLRLPLGPDPFASERVGDGNQPILTWASRLVGLLRPVRPFIAMCASGDLLSGLAVGVAQRRTFPPTFPCLACWLSSQPDPSASPCGVCQNEDPHPSVPGVDGASRNEQRDRLVAHLLERTQDLVEDAGSSTSK